MEFHFGAAVVDDTSYHQALEKRARIRAQLQALQKDLRDVEEFVALHERLFPPKSGETYPIEDGVPLPAKKRERNLLSPARLAEICREILIQHGRPMTRGELLTELQGQGIPLAGSDPSKNLGTILWRARDRFISVPGRGYWPSDVALRD